MSKQWPERTVKAAGLKLIATDLGNNLHLVRVFPSEHADYDRLIVVAADESELFLMGWTGAPLSVSQWREAAAVLFPMAETVRFERRRPGAAIRHCTIRLKGVR